MHAVMEPATEVLAVRIDGLGVASVALGHTVLPLVHAILLGSLHFSKADLPVAILVQFLETLFQPRIALGVQFGLRDLTVAVGVKLRKCLVERRGHFYFREIAVTVRVCSPRAVTIGRGHRNAARSEEHTSELQSLMRISYAVFCLKKKIPQH